MSDDLQAISVGKLLARLRNENSEAEKFVFNHYFPRLTRLANTLLQGIPSASQDNDDLAQSTLKSFMVKIRDAQDWDFSSHDSLWAFLAEMTRRKAANRLRHERAQKRGGGKVINAADCLHSADDESPIDHAIDTCFPSDFDIACEELLLVLPSEELRQIAVLVYQGHSQTDIKRLLKRQSASAIQRKVKLIRSIWRQFLGENENS